MAGRHRLRKSSLAHCKTIIGQLPLAHTPLAKDQSRPFCRSATAEPYGSPRHAITGRQDARFRRWESSPTCWSSRRFQKELKAKVAQEVESGEASLRGHLKSEGDDTGDREE